MTRASETHFISTTNPHHDLHAARNAQSSRLHMTIQGLSCLWYRRGACEGQPKELGSRFERPTEKPEGRLRRLFLFCMEGCAMNSSCGEDVAVGKKINSLPVR